MFIDLKNTLTDEITTFKSNSIFQKESFDKITNWVKNNLDMFNLNEEFSCDVKRDGTEITITGDEDRIILILTETINNSIKL